MAAARTKKSSRKKKPASRSSQSSFQRLGLKVCIWIAALGLTALGLVGVLLVPENTKQDRLQNHGSSVQTDAPAAASNTSESALEKQKPARVYEQIPSEAPERPQEPKKNPPLHPSFKAARSMGKPSKGPCLAVVIDDMGQSLTTARELLQIMGSDLTWAILPYSAETNDVVKLAAENGLEYLLHVPMEPKRYPQVDPGPGSILVDMTPEQIRAILINDLEQIPGAVGANNHMGSRFTEDVRGMRVVLQEITSRNLFFMDSLTSPQSTIRDIAREVQTPVAFRDVFLDNRQDVDAILAQLNKAQSLALRTGQAVAIGHPYPETLTALAKWSKERDSNVELVTLSRVVERLRPPLEGPLPAGIDEQTGK